MPRAAPVGTREGSSPRLAGDGWDGKETLRMKRDICGEGEKVSGVHYGKQDKAERTTTTTITTTTTTTTMTATTMTETAIGQVEHFTREQIFGILSHINYPHKPDVLPEPTLENLRELQYRCVTSIPFETLSLRTTKSRGVDISLQGIYDRIVNQRRGGWCFSLNRLAYELLLAFGYKVQFVLARVCRSDHYGDPIVYGPLTHQASIVRFSDGAKYLFDIGYGNTFYYPIPLEEGGMVEYFGHKRRITKAVHNEAEPNLLGNPPEELWRVEEYMGQDRWMACYAFTEQQYYDIDCEMGNYFTSYSPKSSCFTKFLCLQGTPDGTYHLLINKQFKIRTSTGTQETIVFEKEQERLDVLEKYFGIVLTEEELKYHDQKIE
ncbi:N-terminal acetyltransferase [Modicella reniformis]|uniref:N-terminal acetyltransferase n=1 Tax=Modicella reniformis TaxID=1440133 RepID=A0A9P6MJE3_9FUNG|nr:N-terminal acetyltransferase [Modicella reniformis]